jgi:hypothetical protein
MLKTCYKKKNGINIKLKNYYSHEGHNTQGQCTNDKIHSKIITTCKTHSTGINAKNLLQEKKNGINIKLKNYYSHEGHNTQGQCTNDKIH